MCSLFSYNFDFKYSNKDEFVRGITECTVHFNTAIPPQFRAVVVISVAQAALESSWGESRFARQGNNFYGLIETDPSKPHMKALHNDVMLKKYNRKCESVADYITLLNVGTDFEEYRKVRNKETVLQEVFGDFTWMTFAPRFSPDGKKIIMSFAKDGNSEIYTMDL